MPITLCHAAEYAAPPRAISAPLGGRRREGSPAALLGALAAGTVLAGCAAPPADRGDLNAADMLPVRCVEKPAPGDCGHRRPAFRYDYASNTCRAITDGGCGPVRPFATLADCLQTCGARPAP